jgi:hypothetical protein
MFGLAVLALALLHGATAFVRHTCISSLRTQASFKLASSFVDGDQTPTDRRSAALGSIGTAIKALAYVAVPYAAVFSSKVRAEDKPALAVVLGSSGKTGALVRCICLPCLPRSL